MTDVKFFFMSRVKKWCFTLNNYTQEEFDSIYNIECEYLILGKEVGAEGTPHIQGFIVFSGRKTFNTVKRLLGERCHIEAARGTILQNVEYCSKDNNYVEKGTRPQDNHEAGGAATKRKWDEARSLAKEGRFEEIPSDLWIKYRRAFKAEYEDALKVKDTEIGDFRLKDHFFWIYGPTGTGKSHLARSIAKAIDPNNGLFLKGLNKWWSGYQMQKVVLIEEANPESCKYLGSLMKQWCDKWPFTAETKGGSFPNGIRPDYIIITSNYSIKECFPDPNDHEPLLRRINEFYKDSREAWLSPNLPDDNATVPLPPEPIELARLPRCESGELIIDESTSNFV